MRKLSIKYLASFVFLLSVLVSSIIYPSVAYAAKPATPTGVQAGGQEGAAWIRWDGVTNATSYKILRSTVSGGPYTTVTSNVTGSFYLDVGLSNYVFYYYRVVAVNQSGASGNSAQVWAYPELGMPDTPTGLTVTPGNGQIVLNWAPSNRATIYHIKRSLSRSGPFTQIGTATGTSYTDKKLTNGTYYFYTIDAANRSRTSNDSEVAASTPIAPPSKPTGLVATPGDKQVVLSWTPISDLGGLSYTIKRATKSGGPYTTLSNAVTGSGYTDTGLTNGTVYYYVIVAVSKGLESINSDQVAVIPVPGLLAPAGLTANSGKMRIELSWASSIGATSYNIKRALVSKGPYETITMAGAVKTNSFVDQDTRLTEGKTYFYVVSAVNAQGQESYNSTEVSVKLVPPPVAPLISLNLYRVNDDGSVYIYWNHDAGLAVSGYKINRADSLANAQKGIFNSSQSSNVRLISPLQEFIDRTASPGKTYCYKVFAMNGATVTADSNIISTVRQDTPPSAPIGFQATAWDKRVDLSWQASVGAEFYNIIKKGAGAEETIRVTALTYTDTAVTNGVVYTYIVAAGNAAKGEGPGSVPRIVVPSPYQDFLQSMQTYLSNPSDLTKKNMVDKARSLKGLDIFLPGSSMRIDDSAVHKIIQAILLVKDRQGVKFSRTATQNSSDRTDYEARIAVDENTFYYSSEPSVGVVYGKRYIVGGAGNFEIITFTSNNRQIPFDDEFVVKGNTFVAAAWDKVNNSRLLYIFNRASKDSPWDTRPTILNLNKMFNLSLQKEDKPLLAISQIDLNLTNPNLPLGTMSESIAVAIPSKNASFLIDHQLLFVNNQPDLISNAKDISWVSNSFPMTTLSGCTVSSLAADGEFAVLGCVGEKSSVSVNRGRIKTEVSADTTKKIYSRQWSLESIPGLNDARPRGFGTAVAVRVDAQQPNQYALIAIGSPLEGQGQVYLLAGQLQNAQSREIKWSSINQLDLLMPSYMTKAGSMLSLGGQTLAIGLWPTTDQSVTSSLLSSVKDSLYSLNKSSTLLPQMIERVKISSDSTQQGLFDYIVYEQNP